MWLIAKRIDKLLAENRLTRTQAAREFGLSVESVNAIFDGRNEAGEEVTRLMLAAFGAAEMETVIDWGRTSYAG